jgi:hypothetical protein
MPTTSCVPQVVFAIGGTGAVGSLVPDPAFNWSDNSDASYMESSAQLGRPDYIGRAALLTPDLPGGAVVTGVNAVVRAQAMSGTSTPARLTALARQQSDTSYISSFGDDVLTDGWTVPTVGAIVDMSLPLTDSLLGSENSAFDADTRDKLVAMLVDGAYIDLGALAISPGSAEVTIRVYEFRIDIDYTAPGGAPPLRLTNRDDVFSSAPSLTRSRSQQGTNSPTAYL